MKDEFVALSPVGILALIVAGFELNQYFLQRDIVHALLAALILLAARADARMPIRNGEYKLGWFMRRRIDEVQND